MNRYAHDPNTPSHLRRLVESARGDELDVRRRHRVAERLGIATMTLPHIDPKLERAGTSKASWLSGRAITVTSIALIGGAVGYASLVRSDSSSASTPTMVAHTSAATTTTQESAPATMTSAIVDPSPAPLLAAPRAPDKTAVSVTQLPDVPTAHAAPPSLATATREAKPATDSSDLRLELVALDGVRNAIESARPQLALQRLDEYAARFPAGKLREEATVLRIEALHAAGDPKSAERLANRLLRESPDTPYAARVRAALDKASRE